MYILNTHVGHTFVYMCICILYVLLVLLSEKSLINKMLNDVTDAKHLSWFLHQKPSKW